MAENAIFNNHLGRELSARQAGAGTLTINPATANLAGETIQAMSIKKIAWTGNTTIARGAAGANVIFSSATGTAGMLDLSGNGMANKEQPTSNIVLTVADGGSLFVLVGKQATFTSVY